MSHLLHPVDYLSGVEPFLDNFSNYQISSTNLSKNLTTSDYNTTHYLILKQIERVSCAPLIMTSCSRRLVTCANPRSEHLLLVLLLPAI